MSPYLMLKIELQRLVSSRIAFRGVFEVVPHNLVPLLLYNVIPLTFSSWAITPSQPNGKFPYQLSLIFSINRFIFFAPQI